MMANEVPLLNNRYQLLHPLGTGGMAVVYKSRDLMLERTVAIKVLREDYSRDPQFRERFRQEARAAANLSHPNIVTVHDFGLDQNRLFIVMEYVGGTDLKTLIRQKGKFKVEDAVGLIAQACAGIGYAHRAGLIHCDIKPHNMLVSHDFRLKVTDFGIARALSTIKADEHSEVVWGSPHYFSPEQAAGFAPSPASDVYSLGIILFEMLTGQLPFSSDDASELAQFHREMLPISPRRINPGIPQSLEDIILKVLSKEPSARYRTADQLGRVLLSFNPTNEDKTGPVMLPRPKTGPVRIAPPIAEQPMVIRAAHEKTVLASNHPQSADSTEQYLPPPFRIEETTSAVDTGIDWKTWALGLLAFTAILGLIPFWIYIYFTLNF